MVIGMHDALALLRRMLDNDKAAFRNGQWEAIDELVNKKSKLIVVQRTGWGKSSVYFIATKIFRDQGEGPTIIISPLLALMRNQLASAERLGLNAATINSTNKENWNKIELQISENKVDVLLISPERLANQEFVDETLMPICQQVGMLVVDEVHCISDWGHDFRPDYRRITNILKRLPQNVPVIGTTATANDRVINDIQDQLGDFTIQRGALARKSLKLATLGLRSQTERLAWLAENLAQLDGTGIVYTLTTRDARLVAEWLQEHGIIAKAYFGSATSDEFEDSNAYRQHLEMQLERNEIKALVATSALGMGYDKPGIGFVVHYQVPGSIVEYYQQVGRAGRQIDSALGLLMSGIEDQDIVTHFRETAFPKSDWIESVLKALEESDGLSLVELQGHLNLRAGRIAHVVKFLSVENPSPILKVGTKWHRTAIEYSLDQDKVLRLFAQREEEWRDIQEYVSHEGCLMEFLAKSLNDSNCERCGRCQNCNPKGAVSSTLNVETVRSAERFLRRSEFPLDYRKRVPRDALTSYALSGNVPAQLRPHGGRVLSRWNDPGWGRIVVKGKRSGRFGDDLVVAVVDMLNRWEPGPAPEWVTCIPSLRDPMLVKDFCDHVASRLGIPFYELIEKSRDNLSQKDQENSFYQCRNLDGVFSVAGNPPDTSGLLVDDVVSSGWSLTIGAALLRRAGSGPIWLVALTSSRPGE